jgi:hypothetical protein
MLTLPIFTATFLDGGGIPLSFVTKEIQRKKKVQMTVRTLHRQ